MTSQLGSPNPTNSPDLPEVDRLHGESGPDAAPTDVEEERAPLGATLVATDFAQLAARLPYAEGRLSSERVLAASGARITHLAFAAGEEMREHKAPVPIMIQVVEGNVVFEVQGTEYRLGRGGILHLAAGLPHAVRPDGAARILLTMLG